LRQVNPEPVKGHAGMLHLFALRKFPAGYFFMNFFDTPSGFVDVGVV
jgi:hypothetical protein